MKMIKKMIFTFILLISVNYCNPKPAQLIEMVNPIVYEIAKITNKHKKSDGKVNIDIEYQNIRFVNSYFPSGEMYITVRNHNIGKQKYKMYYKFNGSYIANCTIIYPNGKKIHIQANLAEGNLIKGVTIELNNHISSLIDQIISIPSRLKNKKLAVFQFPTLGKRYTLFGDYVGENIINELSKRGMKVVERGLLKELFKEFELNQLGVVEYGRNEIEKVIKITGASAIVTGTISLINEDVVINCRIISKNGDIISTGKEIIKRYLIPKHYFDTLKNYGGRKNNIFSQ